MDVGSIARGHVWTLYGALRHRIRTGTRPPSRRWECTVPAPWGDVRVRGTLATAAGANTIAVIVHGFGGSEDSGYALRAAAACHAAGISSLRLSLRGADAWGEDVYHAGLVEDLLAALDEPAVAAHEHAVVLGFSLGGHLSLHLARIGAPKLRAVVAVGAPLDLARSCAAFDRRRATGYREYVLRSLKQCYRAFARRHPSLAPTAPDVVDRVRKVRDWDELVVTRRHGFASVDDYHRSQSIAPHLWSLAVPSLYVGSMHDPMVPYATVAPALAHAGPELQVHMLEGGGHVAFPDSMRLPGTQGRGLEAQVVSWAQQRTLGG